MSDELISCILATRNRPRFVEQALRCFEAQTHRNRELIVVDDGELNVRDLCLNRRHVRYIGLPQPTTTGMKLNIGIASASGNILQKYDDDDYYHPKFLETAVAHLPTRGRDCAIVAWDCFLALEVGDPRIRFSGHGWKVGGTLSFSRALWQRCPFRDVPRSVDSLFLSDHKESARVIPVCAHQYYVVVRHGANTWKYFSDGRTVEQYFSALEVYPKPIEKIVARRDREFYLALVKPVKLTAVSVLRPAGSKRSR